MTDAWQCTQQKKKTDKKKRFITESCLLAFITKPNLNSSRPYINFNF